jgi:hypothetical protein
MSVEIEEEADNALEAEVIQDVTEDIRKYLIVVYSVVVGIDIVLDQEKIEEGTDLEVEIMVEEEMIASLVI